MNDRINCRNCIHFNDLEHRCCLNDGKAIQKECYFTLSKRKPQGKDIVIENLKTKVADLEAKLAEKDKEIEKLQHYNDRLAQGIYHSYGEHFISKVKQDKISFAVEKLKEVKKLLEKEYRYDVEESDFAVVYEVDIDEIIDNQIKLLKEKK